MGIWGHRIFEDDRTLDIRGEFRDHIGDGLSPTAATGRLVKSYGPNKRDDAEDYAAFWLGLAATQWELGRLTGPTLRRALEVIDRGIGLDAWGDASPKLVKKRREAYADLRTKLTRPQPSPVDVPRRYRWQCPWKRGDVLTYRLRSGKTVLFRVIDITSDAGGEGAKVDVPRWEKGEPPTKAEVGALPRMMPRTATEPYLPGEGCMYLYAMSQRQEPGERFAVLYRGAKVAVPKGEARGVVFGGFSKLDGHLKDKFGLE